VYRTNRPFRRSDYIVGRKAFNTRMPLHSFGPYANTRGGFIERTIKKETMEIVNKGDRKYGTTIQYMLEYK